MVTSGGRSTPSGGMAVVACANVWCHFGSRLTGAVSLAACGGTDTDTGGGSPGLSDEGSLRPQPVSTTETMPIAATQRNAQPAMVTSSAIPAPQFCPIGAGDGSRGGDRGQCGVRGTE